MRSEHSATATAVTALKSATTSGAPGNNASISGTVYWLATKIFTLGSWDASCSKDGLKISSICQHGGIDGTPKTSGGGLVAAKARRAAMSLPPTLSVMYCAWNPPSAAGINASGTWYFSTSSLVAPTTPMSLKSVCGMRSNTPV